MRCLILTVLFILAAAPIIGQEPKFLDEHLLEVMAREFPEWKPDARNTLGAQRPSSGKPTLHGQWTDGKRSLSVSVQMFDTHKEADEAMSWFFMRSIVPPNAPLKNIGRTAHFMETAGSTEVGFSKANFFVSVYYHFPPDPSKDRNIYTARAPKIEGERVVKIVKVLDAAIDRDRTVTQCYNDFYNPVFPRPTNDIERLLGAAAFGDTQTVKALIAAGADTKQLNANGLGLMHVAVQYGCIDTVKALIEANVDVNSRSKRQATPIMLAANSLQLETIELLLAAGADVNAKDVWGWTPAFYAVTSKMGSYGPFSRYSREDRKAVLMTLKRAGLDLNQRDTHSQDTLLTHQIYNSGFDVIERWTDLLDLGVKINDLASQAQPVLFKVVRTGAPQERAKLVKFLIENGADVNFTDAYGMTARQYLLKDREARAKMPESVEQINEVIRLLDEAGAAR